jgi:hypothetical protein
MRSQLILLFVLLVSAFVFGGGALIWYLSRSVEFSRNDVPAGSVR